MLGSVGFAPAPGLLHTNIIKHKEQNSAGVVFLWDKWLGRSCNSCKRGLFCERVSEWCQRGPSKKHTVIRQVKTLGQRQ